MKIENKQNPIITVQVDSKEKDQNQQKPIVSMPPNTGDKKGIFGDTQK